MAKKIKKTSKTTKPATKPVAKKATTVASVQTKKQTSKKKYYKPKQVKKPVVKQEPKTVVEPMIISLNESLPPVIDNTICPTGKKMCKTCSFLVLFLVIFFLFMMF